MLVQHDRRPSIRASPHTSEMPGLALVQCETAVHVPEVGVTNGLDLVVHPVPVLVMGNPDLDEAAVAADDRDPRPAAVDLAESEVAVAIEQIHFYLKRLILFLFFGGKESWLSFTLFT
jgi:hypothetical protein